MKHFQIRVYGKVQNVGFRFKTMEMAYQCGIKGFVQNEGYHVVYIEAEGQEKNLERFLNWCKKGPLGARIEKVETTEGELKSYSSFDIRRTERNKEE